MADDDAPPDLRAFYLRYIDCCNARDFHRLGDFVASDIHVNGETQCLTEYVQALEAVTAAFADYRWEVQHLLVDGDWLAAHLFDSGTHTGTFLGLPATGRTVSTQEFAHYRVAAGRVVEVWVTADDLHLRRQLE